MEAALWVVWGIALLVIVALLVVLGLTLKGGGRPERKRKQADLSRRLTEAALSTIDVLDPVRAERGASVDAVRDTLLFYFGEDNVRSTSGGEVIVRIPGNAWEPSWRGDLLRVDVTTVETASAFSQADGRRAEIVAAYEVRAYRVTGSDEDVPVDGFAAPVEVVLTVPEPGLTLCVGIDTPSGWVDAPPAEISEDQLGCADLDGKSWSGAFVLSLGRVCVAKLRASEER